MECVVVADNLFSFKSGIRQRIWRIPANAIKRSARHWLGVEAVVFTEQIGTCHAEENARLRGVRFDAVQNGYVSITPLHLDLTHHESLTRLKSLEEMLGHHTSKG